MNARLITAIIPAYNAGRWLTDAIVSMQRQTLPPAEIIVVDDGSVDDTAEVAAAAGARVIRQDNRGNGAARNTGIRAAATPWMALLDADDRARPDRLARQVAAIDADTDVVFADLHVEGRTRAVPPPAIDFPGLWRRNWIPTSTVLLRKSAWEDAGGFDESPDLIGVEDYNLWLRLAHAGKRFVHVDDVLVDYRPTPSSLTAQTRRFAAAELANLRRVSEQMQVTPSQVAQKEHDVYLGYGMELFFARDLKVARAYLAEAARRGPIGLAGQVRRLACVFPLWLLPW